MTSTAPMSSADRFRQIAEIIRNTPERWLQSSYVLGAGLVEDMTGHDRASVVPPTIVRHWGQGEDCGTPGCVAGWAVRLASEADLEAMETVLDPPGEWLSHLAALGESWNQAGTFLLGLDRRTADVLFSSSLDDLTPDEMADVLEHFADREPHERNFESVLAEVILSPKARSAIRSTMTIFDTTFDL